MALPKGQPQASPQPPRAPAPPPPRPPAPPARAAQPAAPAKTQAPPPPPRRQPPPTATAPPESPYENGFDVQATPETGFQIPPGDELEATSAAEFTGEAPAPAPPPPPPPRRPQQQPAAVTPPPKAPPRAPAREAQTITPQQVAPVSQALATRAPAELTKETAPEFLNDFRGDRSGTEEIERGDIMLPRLGLCQALTPQKKQSSPDYIETLQDGQYFNAVTGENYGSWVDVVPILFYKSRIKFFPRDDGGGIDCQALDGKTGGHYSPACVNCKFSLWQEGDHPECTLFMNYLTLIFDSELMGFDKPELIVTSFKSTFIGVAKKWNSLIRMTNLPAFAKQYRLGVGVKRDNQNEWNIPMVIPGAYVDQTFFNSAKQYFDGYKSQKVQMAVQGLDEEDAAERQRSASFDTAGM